MTSFIRITKSWRNGQKISIFVFYYKRRLAFPLNLTTFFFLPFTFSQRHFTRRAKTDPKNKTTLHKFSSPLLSFLLLRSLVCTGVLYLKPLLRFPQQKRSLGGLFSQEAIIYLCGGGGVSLWPHILASGLSQHGARGEHTRLDTGKMYCRNIQRYVSVTSIGVLVSGERRTLISGCRERLGVNRLR